MAPAEHGRHIGIMTQLVSSVALHFWFPINNFLRDASILLKVIIMEEYYLIQVKFKFRGHPQTFD